VRDSTEKSRLPLTRNFAVTAPRLPLRLKGKQRADPDPDDRSSTDPESDNDSIFDSNQPSRQVSQTSVESASSQFQGKLGEGSKSTRRLSPALAIHDTKTSSHKNGQSRIKPVPLHPQAGQSHLSSVSHVLTANTASMYCGRINSRCGAEKLSIVSITQMAEAIVKPEPSVDVETAFPVSMEEDGPSAPPFFIAHSPEHVRLFDKLRISWSVQWQIGVLISSRRLAWGQVTEEALSLLQGDNATSGPMVAHHLLSSTISITRRTIVPWVELDKEEKAFQVGSKECLGISATNAEQMGDWWGGRVEQLAVLVRVESKQHRLVKPENNAQPEYRIELRQQRVQGKSHRFARKYGSRRFIQLQLPDPLQANDRQHLGGFLSRPFILHGRVFRGFFASEGVVHLVETSESYQREPIWGMGDLDRIRFHDFVEQHMPISLNGHQVR